MNVQGERQNHIGGLDPRFRRRLFLHEDGFVLCFFVEALERRHLLRILADGRKTTVNYLATTAACSRAYLHVLLRALAQAGWLSREGPVGEDELTYAMTPLGQQHLPHLWKYIRVARFLQAHAPIEATMFNSQPTVHSTEFERIVDLAVNDWGASASPDSDVAERVRFNLDGALLTVVMLGLWRVNRLADPMSCQESHHGVQQAMRLLSHIGWLDRGKRRWTSGGEEATANVLHYGLAGSYLATLRKLPELLYQQASHITHVRPGQGEEHVDRFVNVLASGHAHRRYFQDADDIFLEIFNREPISQQPTFIADAGCGDGSWLGHIYELVRTRTRRGRHLHAYPLLMVGIDYNAVAARVAQKFLTDAGVPSLVVFGDVTDPEGLARELGSCGLKMDSGLHIRAFLDHNRRYNEALAESNSSILSSRSSGAYVDERGQLIPNRLLERELVGFLKKWVPHVHKHGLVLVEAHCVDPRMSSAYVGEVRSVAFDAYHGLSQQYPVDFNVFMEATEVAGLRPILYHQKRYPSRMPFVVISTNRFVVGQPIWPVCGRERRLTAAGSTVAATAHARSSDRSARLEKANAEREWRPLGTDVPEDGEALHRLLYESGDIAHARAWAAGATGLLVGRSLQVLDRALLEIEGAGREPALSVLDYGSGSGMFTIELLKAMHEVGLLQRIEERGVRFEIALVDIPSSWFAKGYQLLHVCRYARFWALRTPAGRFVRLRELLPGEYDLIVASMVFHLVPRRALPVMCSDLASVLRAGGALLWNSPDIAPARHGSVVFHEPFRRLRCRVLELLEEPSALTAMLERIPAEERGPLHDLIAAMDRIRTSLTPDARALAARAAEGQILPTATSLSALEAGFAPFFDGETYTRSFEMRPHESLDAILVPSNQRVVGEIADSITRRALIQIVLRSEILPQLMAGPAGTADGYSVHWTFGEHWVRRL